MEIKVRGKKYYTGVLAPGDDFWMVEFYDSEGNPLVDRKGTAIAEFLTKLFSVYDGPDQNVTCADYDIPSEDGDDDYTPGEVSWEFIWELYDAANEKLLDIPAWRHGHIGYRRLLALCSNQKGPELKDGGDIEYNEMNAACAKKIVKRFEKELKASGWKYDETDGWIQYGVGYGFGV